MENLIGRSKDVTAATQEARTKAKQDITRITGVEEFPNPTLRSNIMGSENPGQALTGARQRALAGVDFPGLVMSAGINTTHPIQADGTKLPIRESTAPETLTDIGLLADDAIRRWSLYLDRDGNPKKKKIRQELSRGKVGRTVIKVTPEELLRNLRMAQETAGIIEVWKITDPTQNPTPYLK